MNKSPHPVGSEGSASSEGSAQRHRISRLVRRFKPSKAERVLLLEDPLPGINFKSNRVIDTQPDTGRAPDISEPLQAPSIPSQNNATASPEMSNNSNSAFDIYNEHFGLSARPFTLVPDPEFIFWSSAHRRAFTMLEYGLLTHSPITLITGEVGSGKTTLLHHLLKSLDSGIKVGMISNAQGSRGELLRWVMMALNQPVNPDTSYVNLFETFQSYLIEEYADGNRVVLIFDEAQNLSRESLEELRMFTNINSNKDELLQLILVGQPELRDTILRPDLRQFAQRVSASFHIGAMDVDTVQAYIGHRLKTAGAAKNLFNRLACELIHTHTGGVPRLVNQLCDLSMVYAFTNNHRTVTNNTVQQVLDDGTFFGAGAFEPTSGPD